MRLGVLLVERNGTLRGIIRPLVSDGQVNVGKLREVFVVVRRECDRLLIGLYRLFVLFEL